jgi:NAD(P)-dependent dehydrogenase (short-subunit alcohol dehydrogenase family)
MFQAIETKHGPISVLVNSAEIAIPEPFLDTTEENFRKVIDINVVGVFLATQHAARSMIANNIAGSIVNMSSINAVVANPHHTRLLRVQGRCDAADESGFARSRSARHPRECAWTARSTPR